MFDWRKSKPHIYLLSLFAKARSFSTITSGEWQEIWKQKLRENPKLALNRFVKENMLVKADSGSILDVQYKVSDLKNICKKYGLSVSGKKADLINRILNNLPENAIRKLATFNDVYVCTNQARPIVDEYIKTENERRIKAEHLTWEYLSRRQFLEAVKTKALFENERVFQAGLNIDWKNYDLKTDVSVLNFIFSAKFKLLNSFSSEQLFVIRMIAAMSMLWGEDRAKEWLTENIDKSLPFDVMTVSRMVMFYGCNKGTLERYKKEQDIIAGVSISCANDSCSECKKLENKVFHFNNVPELPYENCTSTKGCRCSYSPVTIGWKELGRKIGIDLNDLEKN
jgi:hypothetical protein